MILAERKDTRAIADLDALGAAEPRNAQYVYQRGLVRERQQDVRAIADFKTALSIDKKMADAKRALARVESDSKRWKVAKSRPRQKRKSMPRLRRPKPADVKPAEASAAPAPDRTASIDTAPTPLPPSRAQDRASGRST